MTTNPLSAASLAIYILLLQPTLYIFYRHGWPGFLGWFYLQIFCILRIVSNALSLTAPLDPTPFSVSSSTAGSNNQSSLIVNNIGLSPLLLATAGILHEARCARRAPASGSRASKLEWHLVFHYHFLVSGALALIVAGVVLLEGSASVADFATAADFMKAGCGIVLLCWVLLVVWAGVSLLGASGQGAWDYPAGSKVCEGWFLLIVHCVFTHCCWHRCVSMGSCLLTLRLGSSAAPLRCHHRPASHRSPSRLWCHVAPPHCDRPSDKHILDIFGC